MEMFVEGKNGSIRVTDETAYIIVTTRSAEVPLNDIGRAQHTLATSESDGTLDIFSMSNGNLRLRFSIEKNDEIESIVSILNQHRIKLLDKQYVLTEISPRVKNHLKAPLTAVFCAPDELMILKQRDGSYRVTGYVNSQNSYGALLKTNFTVYIGIGKENLNILGVSLENKVGKNLLIGIIAVIIISLISYTGYNLWYDYEYERQLNRLEDAYDRELDRLNREYDSILNDFDFGF